MNISTKILFYTLTTAFFTFLLGIGIIGYDAKQQSMQDAQRLIDARVREHASQASEAIHQEIAIVRTLSIAIDALKNYPFSQLIDAQNRIFRDALEMNPNIVSTWISWEMSFVDKRYSRNYGRKRFVYSRKDDEIDIDEEDLDMGGDNIKGLYYRAKLNKAEDVTDPYPYSFNKIDSILVTSAWKPVLENKQFVGLAGVDVSLERYENIVSKIRPYEGSFAILFGNDCSVIAGGQNHYVSRSIEDNFPEIDETFDVQERIRKGERFDITGTERGVEYYISFSPITVGNSERSWSLAIAVPVDEVYKEANNRLIFAIVVGVIGLSILAIVITFIATYISRPLKDMASKLRNLEKGIFHIEDKLIVKSEDEIGEVARSVNKLIDTLNETARFANDIGRGKLNTNYELLSSDDTLGKALLEMRSNLLHARLDEEQRKNQEAQQNWIQKGIADSGIILRQGVENMEEFGQNITSFLVKFVEANQGGFFIIDDFEPSDIHIKLVAAYAFDKRRIREKRIEMNEGLISMAVKEREIIYLTNIPKGYFMITSGFGAKLPTSLVLMPLIFEDIVYGVIEIASFEEIAPYQMQFLEQVSERIGAFLANLKKSLRTNILLEASQRQAEKLINSEKEFKSQFNNLHKEHFELHERLLKIEDLYDITYSTFGIAEFTKDGYFERVNEKYNELYFVENSPIGERHISVSPTAVDDPIKHDVFWNNLLNGVAQKRIERIERKEGVFYIEEFFTPAFFDNNDFTKIICISWDITEYVTREKNLQQQISQLKLQ